MGRPRPTDLSLHKADTSSFTKVKHLAFGAGLTGGTGARVASWDDFLIYAEQSASPSRPRAGGTDHQPLLEDDGAAERQRHQYQQLYDPLAKSFNIQPHNLVKKTISIKDLDGPGATWHLMSYF